MKRYFTIICIALTASAFPPTLQITRDLAASQSLARGAGERLWSGYGSAPFGMLLVTENAETLYCQKNPPKDFTFDGRDATTGCERWTRPRGNLPDNLLAAMPVFGPESTIVMGTPEKTGFEREDWLRTILHEHFHQWQSSRPGYYLRVDALDLKSGDASGMWMLNFPFPYADPTASSAYARASNALGDALEARGTREFLPAFDRFLSARRAFADSVGPRNWRYLDFQLWQEGGARWTEYAIAKAGGTPAARDTALAGEARTLSRLRSPDLAKQGRDLAYTYGTAEIMLADACGSGWRRAYLVMVQLGPIIEAARARCTVRPAKPSRA